MYHGSISPTKKQYMGQARDLPPIPTCRGELGITSCILKEPGCFFSNQRNTGRLTPTEAGVHVSHYPLNELSEPSFATQVVAPFVSNAATSDCQQSLRGGELLMLELSAALTGLPCLQLPPLPFTILTSAHPGAHCCEPLQ